MSHPRSPFGLSEEFEEVLMTRFTRLLYLALLILLAVSALADFGILPPHP